ncbi:MAG: UvrB/UvrC motif-containing protein [Phycisphaerales bacterium JB059]
MERDLTELLNEWPYEPGKINVRLIRGADGEPIIQVRLDLGFLQMRSEGRPDGISPHGFGSLLEYQEARLDQILQTGVDSPPPPPPGAPMGDHLEPDLQQPPTPTPGEEPEGPDPLELDPPPAGFDPDQEDGPRFLTPEDCRALREEALQYYHRYVALLVLEDYDGVIRDTTRNMRVLDLCRDHAIEEGDRKALEQFRPYILMMRARALASQALKDSEPKAAVVALDEGIEALRSYFNAEEGEPDLEASREYQALKSMRDALVPKLPVSQKAELRQRLSEALAAENYELAAILRDELRMLPHTGA